MSAGVNMHGTKRPIAFTSKAMSAFKDFRDTARISVLSSADSGSPQKQTWKKTQTS